MIEFVIPNYDGENNKLLDHLIVTGAFGTTKINKRKVKEICIQFESYHDMIYLLESKNKK